MGHHYCMHSYACGTHFKANPFKVHLREVRVVGERATHAPHLHACQRAPCNTQLAIGSSLGPSQSLRSFCCDQLVVLFRNHQKDETAGGDAGVGRVHFSKQRM